MPKRHPHADPPEVAEVRRWRAKVLRACGGTIEGLVASLMQSQQGRGRVRGAIRPPRAKRTRRAA